MALDEVLLKQQRFGFAGSDGDLDVGDLVNHRHGLAGQARGTEVTGNPLAQIAGLAHIDHLSTAVQHLIDAGLAAQVRKKGFVIKRGVFGFAA